MNKVNFGPEPIPHSPPPPKFPCLNILILLATSSAICIVSISYGGKVSFASRILLLIVGLVSVPSVVNFLIEDWGKLAIAFAEALISTAIVAIFSVWFLGLSSLDIWLGILFLLLLLLLEGAYLLERIQDKVIKRLSNTKQFPLSSAETTRLKKNAKSQILLYGSLPLGLILATGYGWISGLSEAEILSLSIPIILSVASLILVITLIVSASIMTKPLILLDPQAGKSSVSEELNESLWESVVKLFRFRVFVHHTKEQDDTQHLDMAYLVSDLRRIYFYDSVHNVTLLISFVLSVFSIFKFQSASSNLISFGLMSVLLLFMLCYAPYSIGQYHLHEAIVDGLCLEGIKRQQKKKELIEASPLYPQSDFLGALVATGTAGGLITALMNEILKGALK